MEIQSWLLFFSIAFVATIIPGPAVLLATTHGVTYGTGHTVVTILGNISGLFIMSALSITGLSVIILNSSVLFLGIKVIGAAYLIYLGVKLWGHGLMPVQPSQANRATIPSRKRRYSQGLFVALSNPKAIAFTTALFPQFVNPQGNLFIQFFVLALTIMLLSFACLVAYAYAAEKTKTRFVNSVSLQRINKIFATGFMASGATLLYTANRHA